ncbi:MAG TPA: 1-acyl-sn-glycerol-3-phosphate acyltransferase [Acidimicrobiales bacterium]|nr:1-acyl-sn-glycerol-3-phosphate acyltransferase [Acidimicrobiales bacterium]
MIGTGERYVGLFFPEVRGIENVPRSGPVLLVGNHSGLYYMPDVWITGLSVVRRRGLEQPFYGLAYDLLFAIPGIERVLRGLGAIPAGHEQAEAALAQGALVLVYPGGDYEACRPWSERDRVEFGGHRGFVRLALRAQVPVVPVVAHGAHHTVVILSRGERLAHVLGIDRLRIKVFPILLGLPFGITSALSPPLPLPAAITVEFLPALDWAGIAPEGADDEKVVEQCYREVTSLMQATLDRLRAEHPHPLLRGVTHLLRSGPSHLEVPAAA